MNYLDKTGLTYLWNKIKNYINNKQQVFYWDGQSSTDNPDNISLFQKIYDLYNNDRKFVLVCNFYNTLYLPSVVLALDPGLKIKFAKTELTNNSSGTATPTVSYTAFTAETNITIDDGGNVTNVEAFTPVHDSYGVLVTGGGFTGRIVEQGDANSGHYIKYDTGIMICTKEVAISQAVASAYFAGTYGTYKALGAMPATFATLWTIQATAKLTNTTDWFVGNIQSSTVSSMGTARICRPNASGTISGTISVFAIGTWE